jgi:hypothetical protein
MNLKSKIISLVIVFTVFVSGAVYSQGFFNNDTQTSEESSTTNNGLRNDTADPGGPDAGHPEVPGPVGEGFAILSLLSGGYFILKKRNSRKRHEA